MTDIRSRHVMCHPELPDELHTRSCTDCEQDWPCDAIHEADRADEISEHFHRMLQERDKAEAALAEAQVTIRALVAPRDPYSIWQGVCGHLWRKTDTEDCPTCKAEAALAECRGGFPGQRK